MASSPGVAVAAVAGILSFLSPCVLPVVPAFLARLGGVRPDGGVSRVYLFGHALLFVGGFGIVFAVLGIVLEGLLVGTGATVRTWLSRVAGVLIVGFGLHTVGLIELSVFRSRATLPATDRGPGLATSALLGGAFAVGWTPCVGPVLGSTFALAASRPAAAFPVLVAYATGLGGPFLLVALAPAGARRAVAGHGDRAALLRRAFGVFLLGLGVLVFTERLVLLGSAVPLPEGFR